MCSRLRRANTSESRHVVRHPPRYSRGVVRRPPTRGPRSGSMVMVMRTPLRGTVAGLTASRVGAGEGEEHVVEAGLTTVEVDGVDAGVVERAHDVDHARALGDRRGDDEHVFVERRVVGRELRERAGRGDQLRRRPTTFTSMRSLPMRAFSSSGVPWATARPWSSTTMSSASRSASSRYCVVRISVVPSRDELAQQVPEVVAATRVEAGGRLVEEEHLGVADEARREVEAPAHAAREGLHEVGGLVGEVELLEQLVGAAAGVGLRAGGAGGRPSRG